MTRKEVRKTQKMNMEHFLEIYFNIESSELLKKLSRMSHRELKEVAVGLGLSKIPFEALTLEMLSRGDVILVEDIHGNPAPYKNPLRTFMNEYETTLDEEYVSYQIKKEEDENDKHKGR